MPEGQNDDDKFSLTVMHNTPTCISLQFRSVTYCEVLYHVYRAPVKIAWSFICVDMTQMTTTAAKLRK